MSKHLKNLSEQVIVITGASSGIGLATAKAATQRGAKLVLAARSGNALNDIAERINANGGEAVAIECDVADREQVNHLADVATERFGRIDTWINNAALGIYGRLEETPESDARRLFDINFWGVVNGSQAALPHLKRSGGALINVGSEVSDAFPPILGMYVASKHAVKGYTDVLRVEIEEVEHAPVSITLIQPTAVDTPFPQHARNLMDREPMLPKPRIEPEDVAEAILEAATTPTRTKAVGTMSWVNSAMAKLAPGMADTMAAGKADEQQYDEPPRNPEGTLFRSSEEIGVVGRTHGTGGREPN
jgi:short-subunit dehydrogenase